MSDLNKQKNNNSNPSEITSKRETRAKEIQHPKGKLTAMERVSLLVDDGSFKEIDQSVTSEENPEGEAVITGTGLIHGRPVYLFSEDFSVMGGSLGKVVSEKIIKIMDLALEDKVPIIGIKDSGGARIQEGIASLNGYANIFKKNVQCSGVVPQISVVVGPSAGGAVYSPALTDIIFQVKNIGQMYVTGPAVVKTVTGEDVSYEELGGVAAHGGTSGVSHQICKTEKQAFQEVRYLMSFLPQSAYEKPPVFRAEDSEGKEIDSLNTIIPENTTHPYNMKDIIDNIVDNGDFYQIHQNFAKNIITGFCRFNGSSVGIVANQPTELAGVLDIKASEKAARFVRFCDAFNIPIVTLVDVPGFLPGVEQEHGGIIKSGAKLLYAYAESTVPRICIITRKAYGGAYIVMDSIGLGADKIFAWPSAEVAVMGAEGAVDIIYKKKIGEAEDSKALRAELINEYKKEFNNPKKALQLKLVESVVTPSQTRKKIIQSLIELEHKVKLGEKHGNIPL